MIPNRHPATSDFAASTALARKVLIIEIAGLGDLVHSLPSMWSLRQAYPHAELHCVTRKAYAALLSLAPWIDRVLPYDRRWGAGLRYQLDFVRQLRAMHYDVVINLAGSDYSCFVSAVSGARRSLTRRPGRVKRSVGWRLLQTDLVDYPLGFDPMYLQRWRCLQQAGFTAPPEFHVTVPQGLPGLEAIGDQSYLHVSPYSRNPLKQMPPAQLVELLTALHRRLPEQRVVLSCAHDPAEQLALRRLVEALPFRPWQVFAGTLDIPQLCALIQRAALHLSGDSGSMHLAWLLGTPSVSWFVSRNQLRQWAPDGSRHAAVVIAVNDPSRVTADNDEIIARSMALIHEEHSPDMF